MKKILAVVLLICFCIGIAACGSNNDTPVITLGSRTTESVETEETKTTTVTDKTTETTESANDGTTVVTETVTETTKDNVTTNKETETTSPATETTTKEKTTSQETTGPETTTKDPDVTTEETTREDPFIDYQDFDCVLTFYADEVMGKRIDNPYTFVFINAYYDIQSRTFVEKEVNSLDYWNESINDNAKRSLLFESAPVLNVSSKLVIKYDEAQPSSSHPDSGTAVISAVYAYVYDDSVPVADYKDISSGNGIERIDFENLFSTSGLEDLYVTIKVTQFGDFHRVGGENKTEYIDYYAIIHVHHEA